MFLFLKKLKALTFSTRKRKIITFLIIFFLVFFGWKITGNKKSLQYQTAQAEKGTLITSVAASGQITTANNVSITIQASGAVKEVYVKNGDQVAAGQKIADLTLDQASQQKQAAALASYYGAQNSFQSAQAKINSLQAALFVANQKFINDRGVPNPSNDQKADPVYIEENGAWLQAEADYKNQTLAISQAQAALSSASLSLSQTSSTITAPVSGVVKGLTITKGAIITLSSSSNSAVSTSQVLGSIYQTGPIQAQVNISEIDSVKVGEEQKVTLTLDAFPNKTFTGKVVSINTNGIVSSGVTAYPAVISFDTSNDHMYLNMAVTAKIITSIKNDVALVPSGAIQTSNGSSAIRVMKNGNPISTPVEIGDSNDTQTEITSGIKEGDIVVTGVISTSVAAAGASPFGSVGNRGFGGFGGGVGGGGLRIRGN